MQKDIIERVISHAQLGRTVAVEGPPIYLYPGMPSHRWDHPAFVNGWRLVEQIHQAVPTERIQHWALFDDLNFNQAGVRRDSKEEVVRKIQAHSPALEGNDGLRQAEEAFHIGRGYWESELSPLGQAPNTCDVLDAGFQLTKLTEALRLEKLPQGLRRQQIIQALEPLPTLVVIHPEDFQDQQRSMLTQMLGKMRKGRLNKDFYHSLSSPQRIELLERTYEHIWLDHEGHVSQISRPVWNPQQSVFDHQPIILGRPGHA